MNDFRKHTLIFLKEFKQNPNVFLDIKVNMDRAHDLKNKNPTLKYTSIIIYAASKVLKKHPRSRAFARNSYWNEKIIKLSDDSIKVTINKKINGLEFVDSKIIESPSDKTISEIQKDIDLSKQKEIDKNAEKLEKIPLMLGYLLFHIIINKKRYREKLLGTYSITTLGGYEVEHFYPITASSVSFGIGKVDSKNQMSLVLSFDHRVIDGVEAATILQEIKYFLENMEIENYELLGK